MTMATNAPVEKKVKSAAAAAAILGALVAVLNATLADSALLGSLPPWLQAAVTLAGPPLAVFWAGWQARHTPRSDLDARRSQDFGGL